MRQHRQWPLDLILGGSLQAATMARVLIYLYKVANYVLPCPLGDDSTLAHDIEEQLAIGRL